MIFTPTPANLQTDVYSTDENYSAGLASFLSALNFCKLVYYVSESTEDTATREHRFAEENTVAYTE